MTVAEIIYAIEQAKEEGILPELAVASDVSLPTLYRILQKEVVSFSKCTYLKT